MQVFGQVPILAEHQTKRLLIDSTQHKENITGEIHATLVSHMPARMSFPFLWDYAMDDSNSHKPAGNQGTFNLVYVPTPAQVI